MNTMFSIHSLRSNVQLPRRTATIHPGLYLAILLALLLSSCAKPTPVDMTMDDRLKNGEEFQQQILSYPGPALVLFYNEEYWQSVEMEKYYTLFRQRYGNQIRFCRYPWDTADDGSQYGLEILPTVILFQGGQEVDRIRGIPSDRKQLTTWDQDLDLWLRKTALGHKGDAYSADYTYRFNNTVDLHISNF